MTTRERRLAVAVSAVLGVAAVGFIGYQFVLGPLLTKNRQIRDKVDEIDKLTAEIDDIQLKKRKYEAQRQQSLPNDPTQGAGVSRHEYGTLLEHMCRRAELNSLKITANDPDSKSAPLVGPKKPAYTKLSWSVQAKGDLYHVVDFLRLFYSQPLLHTVKSMTLQRPSESRARNARELDVNFKIEALVLDNAPVRPTLLPIHREVAFLSGIAAHAGFNTALVHAGKAHPAPPPGVLSEDKREYLAIAGKNVFFGNPPVIKAPVRYDEDFSPFIVLTSIVVRDSGEIEAAFRDKLNNYDYTITQSPKGVIAVKGEWEVRGTKKLIFGYDEKRPGPTLFYGSSRGGNLRTWRVRRLTASEVIMEMTDQPDDEEERPKPPAVGFLAGGAGVVTDVPEGKMYSVAVGQCLATEPPEDETARTNPMPTKLLRREAFKLIYAPPPTAEGRESGSAGVSSGGACPPGAAPPTL